MITKHVPTVLGGQVASEEKAMDDMAAEALMEMACDNAHKEIKGMDLDERNVYIAIRDAYLDGYRAAQSPAASPTREELLARRAAQEDAKNAIIVVPGIVTMENAEEYLEDPP